MQPKIILLAEDNPDDALIFGMMFKRAMLPHTLHVVRDGMQVIDWLAGAGKYADRAKFPFPQVAILDLKMPLKTGLEVLEWMRGHDLPQTVTTLILSSSDDQKDVARAYELGTAKYFVKTPGLQDLMKHLAAI